MSHAEYFSRPFPLVAKLAGMLRSIAPVRKVFVRLATLLRGSKTSDAPVVSEFLGEIPGITDDIPETTDETPDTADKSNSPVIGPSASIKVTLAPECSVSAREQLIRRRWAETGIKMWAGQGALYIQGSAELLPLQPGATSREYDRLEFKLIAGDIVCEGIVVDPPKRRK
jgi:hypothetical protein